MRPRVYRQSPGRWYVKTTWLPFHPGPFSTWDAAYAWARRAGDL